MPDVRRLLPDPATVDADQLVQELRAAQRGIGAFSPEVVDFAAALSKRLRTLPDVRERPALAALAHWIRPASIEQLRASWMPSSGGDFFVRVPRGLVFHMPPTNVDTLFVYTWLLSALVGNSNVIRISPNAVEGGQVLLDAVDETLRDHPRVAAMTAMVSYGHDAAVTAAFSRSDVRVIWGGDDTVAAIRAIPRSPHTAELSFPDRFSFTLLDAHTVASAAPEEVHTLAHRFFNDAYWFDQLGCASPRLVVWRGDATTTTDASGRLFDALTTEIARRGYSVAAGAVMAKVVHVAEVAASGLLSSATWRTATTTRASFRGNERVARDSPGGGLFYEMRIDHLDALVDLIDVRDQTMTHYGIDRTELFDFAADVGAAGLDRIVPLGDALSFDRFWDGRDLLGEFTRTIVVR